MTSPQIVWLRRDLRLADQPAFHAAAQAGPVIPVFVLDEDAPGDHAPGGAARWWLHHSLDSLGRSLARHRSRIVLRRGDAVQHLATIAQAAGAGAEGGEAAAAKVRVEAAPAVSGAVGGAVSKPAKDWAMSAEC